MHQVHAFQFKLLLPFRATAPLLQLLPLSMAPSAKASDTSIVSGATGPIASGVTEPSASAAMERGSSLQERFKQAAIDQSVLASWMSTDLLFFGRRRASALISEQLLKSSECPLVLVEPISFPVTSQPL